MLILEELLPPGSIGIAELAIHGNAGCPVLVRALQGHHLLVEGIGGITLTGFDAGAHFESFQVLDLEPQSSQEITIPDYLDSTT